MGNLVIPVEAIMNTAAKSLDRRHLGQLRWAIVWSGIMLSVLLWANFAWFGNGEVARWITERGETTVRELQGRSIFTSTTARPKEMTGLSAGCWAIQNVFAMCWNRRPGGAAWAANMPGVGQVSVSGCYWGFTQRSQYPGSMVKWCEWTGF